MRNKIRQIVQTECFLIQFMFQTDWKISTVYWLVTGIDYLIPLLQIWLWKIILDQLTYIYQTGDDVHSVWKVLGCYLFLQVLDSILSRLISVLYAQVSRKATYRLDCFVMEKMSEIPAAFFDDPANHDILEAAQSSSTYVSGNLPWAISTLIRIIVFLAGLAVFLSYNWLIGILFMLTYIPGAIISYRNKVKTDEWSLDTIPETRKKDYYKSLLTGSFAAKDLRMYNLAEYYKEKYNTLWTKIRQEREKLFVRGSAETFLASLLTYAGIVIMIIYSVASVMEGSMLIGTLALYVGLSQSTGENFKQILEDLLCQIEIDVPRVMLVREFLRYTYSVSEENTAGIVSCPEIEFREVSFRYPGSDEYTLRNLSFHIAAGKKAALIGVNGAGKSTVVKLLLRFYEPTSGTILLNGKDIRTYPIQEYYTLFGVCFQSVNRYAFTLQENIALSDISRVHDLESIRSATRDAGADSIIRELENGYKSDMTRMFHENGAELSGGQWQKIALARTFFRNAPFMILDEPSSALDPEAEDTLFSSFRDLCRDKGGLLISHRLSGIMMVDEILLMDKGSLAEQGTHTELMLQNGKYAEMYRMQAEKYTGGDADA